MFRDFIKIYVSSSLLRMSGPTVYSGLTGDARICQGEIGGPTRVKLSISVCRGETCPLKGWANDISFRSLPQFLGWRSENPVVHQDESSMTWLFRLPSWIARVTRGFVWCCLCLLTLCQSGPNGTACLTIPFLKE